MHQLEPFHHELKHQNQIPCLLLSQLQLLRCQNQLKGMLSRLKLCNSDFHSYNLHESELKAH